MRRGSAHSRTRAWRAPAPAGQWYRQWGRPGGAPASLRAVRNQSRQWHGPRLGAGARNCRGARWQRTTGVCCTRCLLRNRDTMAAILIIDDDPDFRDSLSETLADLGHASVSAATARAGLAALDTADFDAVLLDFRLPDGDGLEVLRGMAPAGGPPALPVIMLTAFASPDNT